jgi:hypothetical protein
MLKTLKKEKNNVKKNYEIKKFNKKKMLKLKTSKTKDLENCPSTVSLPYYKNKLIFIFD